MKCHYKEVAERDEIKRMTAAREELRAMNEFARMFPLVIILTLVGGWFLF